MSFSIEEEEEKHKKERQQDSKVDARRGSFGNLPHFAAGQSGVENPLVKGISNIYAFKLHQLQPRAFTRRIRSMMSNCSGRARASGSGSGRKRGVAAATLMQFSFNFNKNKYA